MTAEQAYELLKMASRKRSHLIRNAPIGFDYKKHQKWRESIDFNQKVISRLCRLYAKLEAGWQEETVYPPNIGYQTEGYKAFISSQIDPHTENSF